LFLNVGIAPSHIEHLAELKSDQFTNTQNQMGGLIRHHLMKHLIATASVKIPLVQDPRHFLDIELWLHWCENIAKNIHFWFDYVCLPQHPQNDSEDKYFHEALDFLELIQKQMNTLLVDLVIIIMDGHGVCLNGYSKIHTQHLLVLMAKMICGAICYLLACIMGSLLVMHFNTS
jgi:hypothetical protein